MTSKAVERVIGHLLRFGVLLSACVVAGGGAWWLARSGHSVADYGHFQAGQRELRSVGPLLAALIHPRPEIVIQLGLILLIATPVARVVFTIVVFALQCDRVYVAITAFVLVVLAYSLVIPHG